MIMTSLNLSFQDIDQRIDQAALKKFKEFFQPKSRLVNSASEVFVFSPPCSKELDKRQFKKYSFSQEGQEGILIDVRADEPIRDINGWLKDPEHCIWKPLHDMKERFIDCSVIAAAIGDVQIESPKDAKLTTLSAEDDGVRTIDATAGITDETIKEIRQDSIICVTGKEYIQFTKFLDKHKLVTFAGSSDDTPVDKPVLPETKTKTQRSCVVLAPKSVAISMGECKLSIKEDQARVSSWNITIDFMIRAVRTEGARVQKITTTI